MKISYFWLTLALLITSSSAQDLQGNWQASVQESGRPVRYLLRIRKTAEGFSATVDVPATFLFDNTVDSISVNHGTLQLQEGQVTFEGSVSTDVQSIEGTWSLGGELQSVTWHRLASDTADQLESVARHLRSLIYLNAEQWKLHAGDIPHGESVELDDSSWQAVGPNSFAPDDAVWYRRWIEVPKTLNGYDVTGAKAWFDFQYDANGPVTEILYFNGRRVAMGDELEPIVLFEQAHPGDKVLVAVKLLRSVDRKHFLGARVRLEFPGSRPDPSKYFQELGAVSILGPQAGGQMESALNKSADAVDLGALARADQREFDSSLVKASGFLDPLKSQLQQSSIRMTGNSHIDAAWLWPWTETVDVVRRTFGTALQLMEEYPQVHIHTIRSCLQRVDV